MRRFWRSSNGSAAVEAALLLPVLLTITLGGIDLSRYFYLNLILRVSSQQVFMQLGPDLKDITLADLKSRFDAVIPMMSGGALITTEIKLHKSEGGSAVGWAVSHPYQSISPLGFTKLVPDNLIYLGWVYEGQ
ncbi:MAG: pilus assembly protein [Sneathiella sp.]|nr:pilus assembly protein [Sneathiella sp.]